MNSKRETKWKDIDDWARIVDREITNLRGDGRQAVAAEEALAVLDTSFAELQAASEEVRNQAAEVERAAAAVMALQRKQNVLLELVTDAVVETDAEGIIRSVNPAAARFLNVRADYLVKKPFVLFVAEDDRRIMTNSLRALGRGDAVTDWEIRLQPRNGPVISTRFSAGLAGAERPLIESVLWVFRDSAQVAGTAHTWRVEREKLDQEIETRGQVVKDLDEAMRDRLAGLRKMARRVVELEDLEGQKLARDLRERFGQALGAVRLNLANLVRHLPELAAQPLYRESLTMVEVALKNLRALYFELSPPMLDGAGVVGTIRQIIGRIALKDKVVVSLEADDLPALPPDVESTCVWCVREAINNAMRHAGASHIRVTMRREMTRLHVDVTDDGRGFNLDTTRGEAEKAGCFGLVGIEERVAMIGGDVEIRSAPRQGTTVSLTFIAPSL